MHFRRGGWAVFVVAALIAVTSLPAAAEASAAKYVVQPGDTLWTIAARFHVSVEALIAANGLRNPDSLQIGQTLIIPTAGSSSSAGSYVVQPGDTLWDIASRYDTTPARLAALNGISQDAILRPGQRLRVTGTAAPSRTAATASTASPATATYTVKSGDTLWTIARRYDTTTARLAQLNGISEESTLRIGQRLAVPGAAPPPARSAPAAQPERAAQPEPAAPPKPEEKPAATTYTVKPGDTLWSVAKDVGSTAEAIAKASGIDLDKAIHPGDALTIPANADRPQPADRPVRTARRELPYRGIKWANAVIAFAQRYLGRPYRWGASGPRAFDCSGYLDFVFSHFSIQLPRMTFDMFRTGLVVPRDQLKAGDVVFFTTYAPGASHAGIYMGGGNFIHASSGRGWVTISALSERYYAARYIGARRY